MASVTISRKPEKDKVCIKRKEGKRVRYYCVDNAELKDYLYDIIYMQKNSISLAVRIVAEKKKYYEYVIAGDRAQINEKEINTSEDPESFIAREYLGEPIVIIREPLEKLKRIYGPPWYQDKRVITLIVMWSVIAGGAVFFYENHKNKKLEASLERTINRPLPLIMGKSLSPAQKTAIMEAYTKDALYQIAYAIEQVASDKYPAYISSISYSVQDEGAAPGRNETLNGNLDITFRFAYPAEGSKLITTKPVAVYSKTVHINLPQSFSVQIPYMDTQTCGLKLLKDGLDLYNVDNLEFKGNITSYKNFYDFIQTMFYCKGYMKSLKLTNPHDIVNGSTVKKNVDINAEIDLFLVKKSK